jgi:hypothetical protein
MDCRPNTFLLNDHCRKNFSRVATSSTDGHPLDEEERSEGQSALSGYPLEGWVTKHEFAD